MKWLITAFEPFGEVSTNSSWITLESLRSQVNSQKFDFVGPVPVTFADAWAFVEKEIASRPGVDGVLCLGQAEDRKKISLERLAVNCIDARMADNAGLRPPLSKIDEAGADILWSSIPWENFPESDNWGRSYSAGTYVCNFLFYRALSWSKRVGKPVGFVHIPLLTSQGGEFDDQRAVEALLEILRFLERS